jgi:hypothetical protein
MAINAALKDVDFAQAALESFVDGFAPVSRFTLDASPDAGFEGEVIKVEHYLAAGAAEDFSATEGYGGTGYSTTGTPNTTAVSVTMTKHLTSQFSLTDKDLITYHQDPLKIATQMGHQLAKSAFQYVLSVVTNANYGAAALTSTAANFDRADLSTVSIALNANEVPKAGRFLLIDEDYVDELATDSNVTDGSAFGNYEAIQNGRVPRIHGFDVMGSFFIPANAENLVGVAGNADGIVCASRTIPISDQGRQQGVTQFVQTHPESGLSFTFRRSYDAQLAKTTWALDWLGGVAVGNSSAIERIVSA